MRLNEALTGALARHTAKGTTPPLYPTVKTNPWKVTPTPAFFSDVRLKPVEKVGT
jgi:hypothetical protein